MTVRELENEFINGQKWAVECIIYDQTGNEILEKKTTHYTTGIPKKCEYFDESISYIRTYEDEIYIHIKKLKKNSL